MSKQDFELQPSPPDPQPLKVFALDDIEWWAGYTIEGTLAAARAQAGEDCYQPDPPQYPHELSAEDMQRLTFIDEDGSRRTFAAELEHRVAAGERFPQPFAASEW